MKAVGCVLLGALYSVFALFAFSMLMMGDCFPDESRLSQCESARSMWLLGLLLISLAVAAALTWIFMIRPSNKEDGN